MSQENFEASVRQLSQSHGATDPAWLGERRNRSLNRFLELGLPAPKQEIWKYSPIKRLSQAPWLQVSDQETSPQAGGLESLGYAAFEAYRVVLLDGHFRPELSELEGLPESVHIAPLSQALKDHAELLEPHLGNVAHLENLSFGVLNAAVAKEGLFVSLPKNVSLKRPIHFVSLASDQGKSSFSRLLVLAGSGSKATLLESYQGPDEVAYTVNSVSEILLEENAVVTHLRDQREGNEAYHVAASRSRLSAGAQYIRRDVNMGSAYCRQDLEISLKGENSFVELDGLNASADRQHFETFTTIDHAVPHCVSNELIKSILDGNSTGVFRGRVLVREDAQLTDSQQQNKNLLLSPHAQINTKPELEIYADDVKAAHGATIGQLDEEALFFLRARGISKENAKRLLLQALAQDILNRFELEPVKEALKEAFSSRFTKNS